VSFLIDFVSSSLVLVEPVELSRISLHRASVLIEKSRNCTAAAATPTAATASIVAIPSAISPVCVVGARCHVSLVLVARSLKKRTGRYVPDQVSKGVRSSDEVQVEKKLVRLKLNMVPSDHSLTMHACTLPRGLYIHTQLHSLI
jgi:hypothetical protein